MNSIVEADVRNYLQQTLRHDPYECGAIMFHIRRLAQMAGHDVDHRFARLGLGAGPEGRLASEIVARSMVGCGGTATEQNHLRVATNNWVRTTAHKGR